MFQEPQGNPGHPHPIKEASELSMPLGNAKPRKQDQLAAHDWSEYVRLDSPGEPFLGHPIPKDMIAVGVQHTTRVNGVLRSETRQSHAARRSSNENKQLMHNDRRAPHNTTMPPFLWLQKAVT